MDSIKKFFDKKKKDTKFKLAGEGKKLGAPSEVGKSHRRNPNKSNSPHRYAPTSEAKRAGEAALARFETHGPKDVNWSSQAIKAQAKREMEAEKRLAELNLSEKESLSATGAIPKQTHLEAAPLLAVQGVYFHCPLLGPEIETYDVVKSKIRDFLYSQLGEDKGVAACLIIHTCNKNKEKINVCIDTLCKYIENIVTNATDEKYRKIRQSNRAYQDRVGCLEGTKEFFEAAGFESKELPFNETTDNFWVLHEDKLSDLDSLEGLRDALVSAEPLRPQLDRSLRVLFPIEAANHTNLPPEFFALSAEELKKEQQLRTEAVERNQMLMTKTMKEKMELKEIRKYRFTLMRIRFPDGIILQGTFAVNEKLSAVLEFIRECLTNSWRPFELTLSGGGKVNEEDTTLFDLRLVPAVIFNFEWDKSVQDPNLDDKVYLTDDIMMLLQTTES